MPLYVDKVSTKTLEVNGTEINKNGGLSYKVYTALLTQSGTSASNGENGGTVVGNYPELVIGRTYYIADNFQLECDFTNVGAPNNDGDTYFVATGPTPNNWGTGSLEFDLGAPVVTVLENTIGNVWFTYNGVGVYRTNSNGLFTTNKTTSFIQNGNNGNSELLYSINTEDANVVSILTSFVSLTGLSSTDSGLTNTTIEIRVYN
jgi:hypothetical protein